MDMSQYQAVYVHYYTHTRVDLNEVSEQPRQLEEGLSNTERRLQQNSKDHAAKQPAKNNKEITPKATQSTHSPGG